MAGTEMNQSVYNGCRLLVSYPPFLPLHQERLNWALALNFIAFTVGITFSVVITFSGDTHPCAATQW